MATTAENTHDFVPLWAIHAERDGRPSFRGWAKTQAEATAKMTELQADDQNQADTEYWVMQMTRAEVASFQAAGVMPPDA